MYTHTHTRTHTLRTFSPLEAVDKVLFCGGIVLHFLLLVIRMLSTKGLALLQIVYLPLNEPLDTKL
jgi:hypothetical protein